MCFSAAASFSSAVVIGGIGGATLPLVSDRRQLAFAGLPIVFCAHQLLEGTVWLQVNGADGAPVRTPAVELWLLIAWTLLPVMIPLAVRAFEPDHRRRQVMLALAVVGLGTGASLGIWSMMWATTVVADQHHLVYTVPFLGWLVVIPYGAATCLPMLASTHRFVCLFGMGIASSMAATIAVDGRAFTSIWCFFAATLSVTLYVHYARARQPAPVI